MTRPRDIRIAGSYRGPGSSFNAERVNGALDRGCTSPSGGVRTNDKGFRPRISMALSAGGQGTGSNGNLRNSALRCPKQRLGVNSRRFGFRKISFSPAHPDQNRDHIEDFKKFPVALDKIQSAANRRWTLEIYLISSRAERFPDIHANRLEAEAHQGVRERVVECEKSSE